MKERNPFYLLLLAASVVFVVTVLGHALVPWASQPRWLKKQGWLILLVEVAAVVLLGLASMGLDRWRQRSGARSRPPAEV